MWKFTQRSWTGGRLDAELMGRQDLQKYFQGASELKNMLVRRQGYVSKRRGTDLACDLQNLLGHTTTAGTAVPNKIGKARIVPLIHQREKGYYLLVTGGRAFLCSNNGIRLMDGTWTRSVADYELTDYNPESESQDDPDEETYEGDLPFAIGATGYSTLQAAVNAAQPGKRIKVYSQADKAEEYDIANAYAAGAYVKKTTTVDETATVKYYYCLTAKAAGAAWTDANWQECVSEEVFIPDTATVTYSSDYPIHLDLNGHALIGKIASATAILTIGTNSGTRTYTELILENSGARTYTGTDGTSQRCALKRRTAQAYPIVVLPAVFATSQRHTFTLAKGGAIVNSYTGAVNSNTACIYSNGYGKINIEGGYMVSHCYGLYANAATDAVKVTTAFVLQTTAQTNLPIYANASAATAIPEPSISADGDGKTYNYGGWEDSQVASATAEEEENEAKAATVATADSRPYYVHVPYSDGEAGDFDYAQSGDTVFMAHKGHAPIKITLNSDETLTKETVKFGAQTWKRPRITNVTMSSQGTGASKTIYYVCTYVKDGIESMPSLAYGFSYNLPWPAGALVTITCDKGANAEEPDYYNVYKMDSTEYGLISTSDTDTIVMPDTEVTYSSISQGVRSWDMIPGGASEERWGIQEFLNKTSRTPIRGRYTWPAPWSTGYVRYCGGVTSGKDGVEFSFGNASGTIITKLTLGLDLFELYSAWVDDSDYYNQKVVQQMSVYSTGTHFRAVMTTVANDGTTRKYHVVTTNMALKAANIGLTTITGYNSGGCGPNPSPATYKRSIDLDFYPALLEAYPTLATTKPTFQTESILIEAFDNATDMNRVDMYWHEVQFRSRYGQTNIIQDDNISADLSFTPPSRKVVFNSAGDYPGAVALYQQRLAYASSENDPFTLWLSAVGDLYNFSPHSSIREDDALEVTLAATEFPNVNHIITSRDLMLLADSGEWKIAPVSGNTLTYKTISADMQSAIGCSATLKPMAVGDEIVFADRTGQRLFATRYNWSSDGYESNDLSVLSQWLFKNNPIVSMAYRQHPDSTIECVLTDGTIATLVYMKEHEVCAWSRHILGGGWKAKGVACNKAVSNGSDEVMLLVEKNGAYQLWRVRDDVPVRDASPAATEHLCMDAMRELETGDCPVVPAGMTRFSFTEASGAETVRRNFAGYVFKAELTTVRPEPQGVETFQFEIKNAKDAEVRILDSGDFTVRSIGVDASQATAIETGATVADEGGALVLASRDFKRVLAGDNTGDGRLVIESENMMPLNIILVATDYEIQPLSGSEG
ncbi:MAG: hypothetical protein J6W80_03495 [Kiritimatiellae bacterium]|nr:hypothetical protein [Kiritimatiellia bacterium]